MEDTLPSKDLLHLVRGGLVQKGTSLHRWCSVNGICRMNATSALLGKRNGPKARALRAKLATAAGVKVKEAVL